MGAGVAVDKYLRRYAEPEARSPLELPARYCGALVVPVFDERVGFLSGLGAPFGAAPGRRLLIVVVNAPVGASELAGEENQRLMEALRVQAERTMDVKPALEWLRLPVHDVLLIDRTSPGRQLPARQGVGLARKLGADLALSLWARGGLDARGFGSTDADASLPLEYFGAGENAVCDAAAAVFPFVHEPAEDPRVTRATLAYELSMRYYVLGLAYAGSKYAYHSLGSTLYVEFQAYAQARGFPKRLAGEDFYLLDKLAKLGAVRRLKEPEIRIRARRSERVPFGTGPGVQRLIDAAEQGRELELYAPRCFEVLEEVLAAFAEFARERDLHRARERLTKLPEAAATLEYLDSLDWKDALEKAAEQAPDAPQLARRLETWFDALRTLRLIHALRDRACPSLGWLQALEQAPFVPRAEPSLDAALASLREAERALPVSAIGLV